MEVDSQIFKVYYRNVVKDRAEILRHTTMPNITLAAEWRIGSPVAPPPYHFLNSVSMRS